MRSEICGRNVEPLRKGRDVYKIIITRRRGSEIRFELVETSTRIDDGGASKESFVEAGATMLIFEVVFKDVLGLIFTKEHT